MEKRLPLALFLSFLVLFAWTILTAPPKTPPDETAPAVEGGAGTSGTAQGAPGPAAAALAPAPPAATVAETEERTLELFVGEPGVPGYYRLRFTNRGGRLQELDFGDYFRQGGLDEAARADPAHWLPLVEPIETAAGTTGSLSLEVSPSSRSLAPAGLADVLWQMTPLADGVEMRYGPGTGLVFTKRVRARPGTWDLSFELEVENQAAGALGRRDFVLSPAGVVRAELGDKFYQEPRAAAVGFDAEDEEYRAASVPAASLRRDAGETLDVPVPPAFVGVHNKYFAFFLRGADPAAAATLQGARALAVHPLAPILGENGPLDFVEVVVPLGLDLPPEGERRSWTYTVYAGPKDREVLAADFAPHAEALADDLGTFSGISRLLLAVLGFFHRILGNWGWAIILLTICVRLALFPLNRRSQTAMARYQTKMKRVQPKMEEIKRRFADDPQKQREAQARLMQEERAFPPLGGCLPMFLQIPVFFGLFSALRTTFDLRQAPFLGWIRDLSRPDHLLELDLHLPLLFTTLDLRYLNLLPILMVVTWVLQQMGMPKPSDEQQARMQKMMMFMPILFGFFLYDYAAGLSLYMITQSTLGIFEQRVIKKVWPVDESEPEPKKPAGCGPFSGILANLAEKQKEQMRLMEARKRQGGSSKQTRRKKRR